MPVVNLTFAAEVRLFLCFFRSEEFEGFHFGYMLYKSYFHGLEVFRPAPG